MRPFRFQKYLTVLKKDIALSTTRKALYNHLYAELKEKYYTTTLENC